MNILFYTTFEVSGEKGGTERITSTIATELRKQYNCRCYSIYRTSIGNAFECTLFNGKKKLSLKHFTDELRRCVIDWKIDVIINQGAFQYVSSMRDAIYDIENCHLLTVHHFNPGGELYFKTMKNLLVDIRRRKDVFTNILKILYFPFSKYRFNKTLHENYRVAYEQSDFVVLLSDKFIPEFISFAGISESNKFRYIHNSLTFDSYFDMKGYHLKKKEVLIVSRLHEAQKRISLALQIWKEIERDEQCKGWILRIVGHGDRDETIYRNYVKSNHLNRVYFEGAQKPLTYYQNAQIFMLTSLFEGWGLTLTEAQQNACVPIAFNTYASVTDIITDGYNGFIIKEGSMTDYTNKLKQLMRNDENRKKMATNAVASAHRFDKNLIVSQWYQLIQETLYNKKS